MRIPTGGIAFFDSGIGGLTVLAECRKLLPSETFYYYGDNDRAPYGNLPKEKIRKYVLQAFRQFRKRRVKAVVLACNTATAVCIDELRKKYAFPIIGAEPAVYTAAAEGGEVLVLSTRATYESPRFRALCRRAKDRFPRANVRACACDGLAGAIERGLFHCKINFADYLPEGKPKTVVLGCTHYGYIKKQIAAHYGCKVLDGNGGIALRLRYILKNQPVDHSRPRRKRKGGALASPSLPPKRGSLFFLGGQKTLNKRIYEQMFG